MSFGTKGCMYCEGECNKECLPQEEPKIELYMPKYTIGNEPTNEQEEPKQETVEEAAARYACGWGEDDDEKSFIAGAKSYAARDYWFKQFKKD
jgi:hypothetical protein